MDSSHHKHRGFIRGKLMFFTRARKPSPLSAHCTSRIRPNQSSVSAPAIAYLVDPRDIKPQQPKNFSFLHVPDYSSNSVNDFGSYLSTVGDESVNMKAASYISSVRERFRLERINSERKV